MIILGIDPGSRKMGYGVVEVIGPRHRLIDYGTYRLPSSAEHVFRLKLIFDRVTELLVETKPDECAVEMPVYGENPQSMLKLGRAQAAAILASIQRQVPVTEYTPKEVKKAVTGKGNAAKEQVAYMVKSMLSFSEDRGDDATDALAVALCHAHRFNNPAAPSKHKNWADFIDANPNRVAGNRTAGGKRTVRHPKGSGR
ncbi:MAG: crossover junction endodeoxyribonuclease RuvC [Bacteroidota bacterium]